MRPARHLDHVELSCGSAFAGGPDRHHGNPGRAGDDLQDCHRQGRENLLSGGRPQQGSGHPAAARVSVIIAAGRYADALAHEEGLGRLQAVRKGFWADREANEVNYRAGLASIDTARLRHVNGSPHPERYDPDLWNDEVAFLARPGEADIQSDLFYDFRNNLTAFPAWQNWLRERRPPTLIVWGRYDPVFDIAEVPALKKDLPKADVHILYSA